MPPSPIQRTVERVRAEAQRLLQSYIGSRPGRDVQPVVERRLRDTLREEFGITLPIEDVAGAAERILREISVPPQQPVARRMGGIPVERFIMDEASWRDILGWGLTASVQAPLQISHLIPQPLQARSEAEQHMAAQIMAAEDQAIFDILDRIGQEGFDYQESRAIREVRDPSGRITELIPDRIIDVSFVSEPTDPSTRIRPGEIYVRGEPGFFGRMPVRTELPARGAPVGFAAYEEVGIGIVNPGARRVTMPEFEIASNPTIQLGDIQARRFDMLERGFDRKAVLMATVVWEAVLAAKRLPTVTPPETRPEF